ncbi:MAG: UDP-N-acetylmuramoyl-tripeptide--D-alanyl-D-alanine ligase [Bacteroidales bacterium]|nr:UDP-N-acetylmuramoyl-tripeptide--D-alanyl-D-alanine ligase [Bacteroidales bacterium]
MFTEQIYQEFLRSTGICTDTRREAEGSLFFALRGEQFDGNRFVEDALNKGCRLAITERKDLEGFARVVVVPSVLEQLQKLANHHRMLVAPRLVAITGSNGKTTTKELLASVLSSGYSLIATRGNLNNHIGVPLTLLTLNSEQVAVVEMGANHPGEIAELARIAAPDVGLITNVGKAHLEGFGSLQGVLDAKGELYGYLAAHGGKAIIDGGDQLLIRKAGEIGVESEVIAPGGDLPVVVRLVRQIPFLEVEMVLGDEVYPFSTKLVGAYNLQNILLAAGTGLHFGIAAGDIADAISGYLPENQRSQMVEGGRNSVVLDSYNANPSSMREAIGGLMNYATSPTMLILGDMAELGDASNQEHRELVQWIGTLNVDRVLLTGPNFYEVCEPSNSITVFRGRSELEAFLRKEKPEGYYILLKGSRVMELERLRPLLVD